MSDLYDRVLRIERRLRDINIDSLSHRQRANSFALLSQASNAIGGIRAQQEDEDEGCTGTLSVRTYVADNPQAGVTVTVTKGGVWVAEGTTTLPSISTFAFVDFTGLPPGTYTASATLGGSTRTATVDVVCRSTAVAVLNTPQETVACCNGTVLLPKTVLITDPSGAARDLIYDSASGLFLTNIFSDPAACSDPALQFGFQLEWNCGTKVLKIRSYADQRDNPGVYSYDSTPISGPTGTCSPLNLVYTINTYCNSWTGPCCNVDVSPTIMTQHFTITPKP